MELVIATDLYSSRTRTNCSDDCLLDTAQYKFDSPQFLMYSRYVPGVSHTHFSEGKMKKILALTTIVVLLAVVIPASAAPTDSPRCEKWLGFLSKYPSGSEMYERFSQKLH